MGARPLRPTTTTLTSPARPLRRVLRNRPAVLAATLAVALLAAAPPSASAQGHEHGAMNAGIAIAHDAPADGRTFVGNVNHFSVIVHGDDAVPDFHQDVPWRVVLNDVTLVETTPDSGHDYDGVNTFDIVFPVAGEYRVEALDASGGVVARFSGTVHPAATLQGGITFATSQEQPVAGQPVDVSYSVHAAGGDAPIAHSDCTFEVVGPSGRTQFRAKTHTHEEEQAMRYAYTEFGAHTVRIVCFQAYPSERATLFQPVLMEVGVDVLPGPPANAEGEPMALPALPPELNAVVTAAAGDGMTLVGTFDPYTVVGPDTLQHLNVLAVDGTGQTIQHVDFTAVLDGPGGRLFESSTLHEYDGILEFTTRQAVPGTYTLRVTAEGAAGTGEIALAYAVAPPVVPVGGVVAVVAGPVAVTLDAAPVIGAVSDWTLAADSPSGPFAHGELELRLLGADSPVPFLQTKVHTHDDGRFPLRVALPVDQAYRLEATPFPLFPNPVLLEPQGFDLDPAVGAPLVAGNPGTDADGVRESPAGATALVLAVLAAAALALRRR